MKKLWLAEVSFSIAVYAENEGEAQTLARRNLHEECMNQSDSVIEHLCVVSNVRLLPGEWEDSIPYGEENDRTCVKILEEEGKK